MSLFLTVTRITWDSLSVENWLDYNSGMRNMFWFALELYTIEDGPIMIIDIFNTTTEIQFILLFGEYIIRTKNKSITYSRCIDVNITDV